ncbi:MAG: hypothetical protein J7M03_06120 [Candidatus Desulfofervidaceae bacterium]|nr:hypothetical protein [Candidatus Desulfofervidaceae bacterium]MDL1970876.1 hypothetical protein [Candidatus Desulfofervidaceae bacterium]
MKKEIEITVKRALKKIPAGLRHEITLAETIKCVLFQWIREQELIPVPHYRPPRRQEEPLPLVAFKRGGEIVYAFAIAPVVTLGAMKTLKAIEVKEKYFITFSSFKKKVEESKFFLTPDVVHIHLGEESESSLR